MCVSAGNGKLNLKYKYSVTALALQCRIALLFGLKLQACPSKVSRSLLLCSIKLYLPALVSFPQEALFLLYHTKQITSIKTPIRVSNANLIFPQPLCSIQLSLWPKILPVFL